VARSGGAHLAGFPARFTLMKKIPTDFSGAASNNIQRRIESDVPSLRQSFLLAETFPDVIRLKAVNLHYITNNICSSRDHFYLPAIVGGASESDKHVSKWETSL
jgi:hypothetical protein